ncbi:hypothetical protein VTJ49DRAFT_936 [Mycothermus thermophilus]|uniref:Uncharacterized protein n=1 Tax=Humicola insolens TaxID=85995 RepID=A0ABR3VE63_HUMIN
MTTSPAVAMTDPPPPPPPPLPVSVPIPPTSKPHLLTIPGEIRNQIYSHLLIFSDPIPVFREPPPPPRRKSKKTLKRQPNPISSILLPLLLTSRLISHEASALFYTSNTFSLPRSTAHRAPLQVQHNLLTRRFLDVIGPRNASHLRKLVLPFPADPGLLLTAHWRESAFSATAGFAKRDLARVRGSRRRDGDGGGGGEVNPFEVEGGASVAFVKAVGERCPNLEFVALDTSGDNHWLRLLRPHACAVRAMLEPVDKALRDVFLRLGRVELWVGEGPAGGRKGSEWEGGRERWSWTSVVEVMPGDVGGGGARGFGVWTTGNGVGVAVRAAMNRREWRWVKQVVEEEDEEGEWKGWKCTVARPEVGWVDEEEEEDENEPEAQYQPHNDNMPRYVHHGRDPTYLLYGPPELALQSEMHDCWTRRTLWLRFAAAYVRSPTDARRELREAQEWFAWREWRLDQAGPPPGLWGSASGYEYTRYASRGWTSLYCDSGPGRSFRDVYPARAKKPLARRVKQTMKNAVGNIMWSAMQWYERHLATKEEE